MKRFGRRRLALSPVTLPETLFTPPNGSGAQLPGPPPWLPGAPKLRRQTLLLAITRKRRNLDISPTVPEPRD